MLVKATAKGYLGSLREIGDEFEVPAGLSASWFAPVAAVDDAKPAKSRKGKAFEAETDDDAAEAI